jgi:hypothetical protein
MSLRVTSRTTCDEQIQPALFLQADLIGTCEICRFAGRTSIAQGDDVGEGQGDGYGQQLRANPSTAGE